MATPGQAAELLDQERWEPALDALLAAWRTHRARELEAPILRLSEHLAAGLPAIDPDDDDWQSEWERRAKDLRAAELGQLLGHVTRPPKGGIPRRVRLTLGYGPDPRIAELLVAIIEAPPTTASSNFSMWTELFAALPEHADSRVRARLETRAATLGGKSQFWPKLQSWIAAVVPKLAEPAQLPAAWKAELAALDRRLDALLAMPALTLQTTAELEPRWESVDDFGPCRAALEADQLELALDHLVGFWGLRRHPAIAALIDRLGVLVDEGQPGPTAETKKAFHGAWMAAGAAPSPSAIGPLLASLREGKLSEVEERIELLADWRPDPRVAQTLVTIFKDYMLGARDRLWRAVFEGLVHHADPRVADDVHARHARLAGANVRDRSRSEGRALRRVYDAFCEAAASPPALTGPEQSQVDAIDRMLVAHLDARAAESSQDDDNERAIVEAIVADWSADGPRLVYSDWLQSRQDPRGNFIALDLALAAGKRVRGARDKWFKAHQSELFGPLARIAGWRHRFERGLLSELQITTRKGGLDVGEDERREILEDLRWATLRTLEVDGIDPEVAEVFAHAPLLALDHLSRPVVPELRGFLRRQDPIPLRSLDLSANENTSDEDWQLFDALPRVLPALESIAIMIWDRGGGRLTPPARWFASALVRRAKQLINGDRNVGGLARVDQWIGRMLETNCPVPRVSAIGPQFTAEVTQVELGSFELDLIVKGLRVDRGESDELFAALAGLPRNHVTGVRLTIGTIPDGARPALDAALVDLPVVWVDAAQ